MAKEEVGTVDITPSWETTMRIYLMILDGSKSEAARAEARAEIERAGRLLDEHQALVAELDRDIKEITKDIKEITGSLRTGSLKT